MRYEPLRGMKSANPTFEEVPERFAATPVWRVGHVLGRPDVHRAFLTELARKSDAQRTVGDIA
jgi:hypothetical protein